ncbi:hypothetical protein [Hoeflea sp.]|uniref:hypothetical protein n=1 Tax=Hoeflea sp. TaxID=1940281 RepID=UPI0019872D6E|nr:hypothetical protein [Hoeflea sp.]MBC7285148.1 hypothetical protein [Hoeflea sp.]
MSLPAPKMLLLLAGLCAPLAPQAHAQEDPSALADQLAPRVLFVTSGGYWEETESVDAAAAPEEADQTDADTSSDLTENAPPRRGYYRLIAVRGEDNRSRVHLQHIALTPQGPELALSMGIEEINALGAYVTDIRPEDSTGAASQAGFAAYIYLKTDPTVAEPETWAVYIDEFGDLKVEQSSN